MSICAEDTYRWPALLLLGLLVLSGCRQKTTSGDAGTTSRVDAIGSIAPGAGNRPSPLRDLDSYSNPETVRVRHLALDLTVDFSKRQLRGSVVLTLASATPVARTLVLDTHRLQIEQVAVDRPGKGFRPSRFVLGRHKERLGAPLKIAIPPRVTRVRIRYHTGKKARGLQWLTPAQTATGRYPFLLTNGQSLNNRSWIPLQDIPRVRVTYAATIHTPPELLALMSADGNPTALGKGVYRFEMREPIASYLIALAVGRLAFAKIEPTMGVYAEPPVLAAAAREFSDVKRLMDAAIALCGPYRFGRYDMLVLPPSFPWGGMENPRLNFLSPTIIAGDKSLVAVLAHELAHSWSGNLVTNAGWRHVWLNEGLTSYLEGRLIESVFGKAQADLRYHVARRGLDHALKTLPAAEQILGSRRASNSGDPTVIYVKGATFFRSLEQRVGRRQIDQFLRGYFRDFAFRSVTTAQFSEYLKRKLPAALQSGFPLKQWLEAPGLPAGAFSLPKGLFAKREVLIRGWLAGTLPVARLAAQRWSTMDWLYFLGELPRVLPVAKLDALDRQYGLTKRRNAVLGSKWLVRAIASGYKPAVARVPPFLARIGRLKLTYPVYAALSRTREGSNQAQRIFAAVRARYSAAAAASIARLLKVP